MFGMGFMEIFLVLIVAVIALGPEKLPGAAVDIARFFKKMKSGIEDAKSTIDNELNISEMKKEAANFQASVSEVKSLVDVDINEMSNIIEDEPQTKKTVQDTTPKQTDTIKPTQTAKKETISMSKNGEV